VSNGLLQGKEDAVCTGCLLGYYLDYDFICQECSMDCDNGCLNENTCY
jgi:hypothetical protein